MSRCAATIGAFGSCVISALILAGVAAAGPAGLKPQVRAECLGGICFGKTTVTQKQLIVHYGPGYTEGGRFASHCYVMRDEGLFVTLDIGHYPGRPVWTVFVSRAPACSKASAPRKPFRPLTTGEGVGIGDTLDKVFAIYGPPDRREEATSIRSIGRSAGEPSSVSPFGNEFLVYFHPTYELLRSEFYIRDGKVSAILISISE